ncbi:MAG: carbon-nitrogen family hydrolase [Acidaminococcaceae bacterium]|nr:carbon-nitrogen family hydrolase [Acidaminococcaceae bacterium]
MKIALLQMEVLEKNKAANVEHGLQLLQRAATVHDILVLPEIWTTGYSLGHLKTEAETIDSSLIKEMQQIALKYGCIIIGGSIPLKDGNKIYNSCLAIDRQGKIVNRYDKTHLFEMYHESVFFGAGNNFDGYKIDGMKLASTVCYDLRFPELYRHLALQGTELMFVVAEWPETRGAVWRLLLQARAAENHLFVVGVNAVGTNRGQKFFGHSMVCAPDGSIVAEGGTAEEILSVEIDLGEVIRVRNVLNALSDVRKELVR